MSNETETKIAGAQSTLAEARAELLEYRSKFEIELVNDRLWFAPSPYFIDHQLALVDAVARFIDAHDKIHESPQAWCYAERAEMMASLILSSVRAEMGNDIARKWEKFPAAKHWVVLAHQAQVYCNIVRHQWRWLAPLVAFKPCEMIDDATRREVRQLAGFAMASLKNAELLEAQVMLAPFKDRCENKMTLIKPKRTEPHATEEWPTLPQAYVDGDYSPQAARNDYLETLGNESRENHWFASMGHTAFAEACMTPKKRLIGFEELGSRTRKRGSRGGRKAQAADA
jgi:hypothetical protein